MNTTVTDVPTQQAQATEIKFFDAGSRIGRVRYLAYPWGIVLLALPAGILAGILFAVHLGILGGLLIIAVEVFALVMSGVFIVRRLHDFDRSGWWSLIYWGLQVCSFVLSFQQILNNPFGPRSGASWLMTLLLLAYLLALVLVPGTQGPNRYGPVPPPNTTWVKVGAVLTGVVFVLAIIVGISLGLRAPVT